ncbi:helix-turn-helix domain-containing protein [Flaviaesturariibacter flavus]|uniref:Helix-turn-helix domain-containing protein n=1 Tax=Flaviaesturariibacter flavus TaxID=2502780 RepID=A0A4V2NWT5_9BACT|nr:helix-turn-helix domain-containing protein [Flaviaesturariibacter flavus]TCJ18612.1 helix-turn-helix domain-containing protein [Flaviaesturariibacter flavus]
MKHVSILIPEGDCSLTHIEATWQILNEVNNFLGNEGKAPLFNVQLVGLRYESGIRKGLFGIRPHTIISEITRTDLVILPALQGDLMANLAANEAYVTWLVEQYNYGASLASFCLGSFLLAKTGLLNGRPCTTHWSAAGAFRELYPEVILMPDKILTEEAGIYTSGGALTFTNLLLYLIEKYAGRAMAIQAAKVFMIDMDRDTQSPFIIFKGQKKHNDDSIRAAQEFIEKNYSEKLSVEELASRFAIGRRNLERRFKAATANTVAEYIQRVKIEAAKQRLESTRDSVNEVMYEVGYSDPKAFRTIFKKFTGLAPAQYRSKYSRHAVGDLEALEQ